ncbi:MAG: hypothetical protein ISR44_07855 [Rhodospirillales bacterium]|nr:hypothetical protein [Rhodospirillales bacterium]
MSENTNIGDQLSFENRRELEAHFRKICNLGANVIVGWRSLPTGMQVFYVPSLSLPQIAKLRSDLLQLDRYVENQQRGDALVASGCRESTINLKHYIGGNLNHIDDINNIIRYYSVTQFESRAVALFDMVSFSVHSPHEQICHVSVLSYYIKLAAARCQSLGMPIQVCMTTTGDGFYVWNSHEGLDADIVLFCAVVLALGYMYAARHLTEKSAASVPRLRCAVHFGSHYEYYQGGTAAAEGGGYIVGDVTISLARLMSKAISSQLLVGSTFIPLSDKDKKWRKILGTDEIDCLTFIALAQNELTKFKGLPTPSGKIAATNVFFTGPRVSEDTFAIRKYYVKDKHGIEHPCFNAKLDIVSTSGDNITFGFIDEDLGSFDARADENEDILIKMR